MAVWPPAARLGGVQAICDYVHNRLSFGYGYARATRTAAQAHEERVGVCRDFAHHALPLHEHSGALCERLPGRHRLPPDPAPMDFNAWFEAFLDGKWYTFDARHNIPRIGRVVVARGRDATDVPLLHSFGTHRLTTFKVWTYEQDSHPDCPPEHGVDRTLTTPLIT